MTTRLCLDPRTRLVIILSLTCGALFFNKPAYLAGLLLITVLLSIILGKWERLIKKRVRDLLMLFTILTVIQSIFSTGGETVLSIRGFSLLTNEGILKGACFLGRMAVITFSSTILLAASSREMIQGLIALKIPYELAFMTSIAISFLPVVTEEMRNSLIALQLRGVDLKTIPFMHRMKIYSYLLQPVLKSVIVKAKELSVAMEMRAFRAFDNRSTYTQLTLKKADYIIMTAIVVSLILSITAYL